MKYIGSGKSGADLREHFSSAPYGWPQDSIDGALYALAVAENITVNDQNGASIDLRKVQRAQIGNSKFKVTSGRIPTSAEKMACKGILTKLSIHGSNDEPFANLSLVTTKLEEVAESAGGTSPAPEAPTLSSLVELKGASGNDLIILIAEKGTFRPNQPASS